MVIYGIIIFLLFLMSPLIGLLAQIPSLNIEWGWASTFFDFMEVVFFLIPVADLWPLLSLIFMFTLFRIIVSVLKFFFDAIPLY